MDVHAETIAVAGGRDGGPRSLGTIANRPEAVRRLLGKLGDLMRAREAAKEAQLRAKHRLGKYLLRNGQRARAAALGLLVGGSGCADSKSDLILSFELAGSFHINVPAFSCGRQRE